MLGLAACGAAPAPAPAPAVNLGVPADRLNHIVERYWDELTAPGNPIAPQFMADSLGRERRLLAELRAIGRSALDGDSRLTYDILERRLEMDIEGFTYPAELLPVNPFAGPPRELALAAADTSLHPLKTVKDYENWLQRIDDYANWCRQAIANMREGMRRGYTSPRSVMERMLPLLRRLGDDNSASVFYLPLRTLPQTLGPSDRTRLAERLNVAVRTKLLPAYRELHDFIQTEYLPRTRLSIALSALPLGPSWYAYRVKRATGTQLTPNEIHAIGLTEVEHLRARLAALPAPPASTAPRRAGGRGAHRRGGAEKRLPSLERTSSGGSAQPVLGGAAGGFRHSGTRSVRRRGRTSALPTCRAGLGVARHSLCERRIERRIERARPAPRVRRASMSPVFSRRRCRAATINPHFSRRGPTCPNSGDSAATPPLSTVGPCTRRRWGSSWDSTRDEDANRGALSAQLNCAAALVVDTGLHAKGWTREQAVDYLRAQLSADAGEANMMTDRFVALPGDALACKIGELKFQALRSRAQTQAGARFDIREFHSRILKDGAMPLDILEARMRLWMEARP